MAGKLIQSANSSTNLEWNGERQKLTTNFDLGWLAHTAHAFPGSSNFEKTAGSTIPSPRMTGSLFGRRAAGIADNFGRKAAAGIADSIVQGIC